MADNQKYYYMRLKEGFYDEDTMKIIESMPDGYLYSNILMKLYLKSLKNNGKLMLNDRIPYSPDLLATITRHQVGTIEKALKLFKELDLIEILDNGAIFMLDIQNFIGKSNTEADRKRAYRARIEEQKAKLLPNGQMSGQCPLEIDIELEKEIEIETEKEIKIEKENENDNEVSCTDSVNESWNDTFNQIIDYLNAKAAMNYRTSSKKTQSLIRARVADGFNVDDFMIVIDKKCAEWIGTEYEKYLRPETLFGTKFEGYLNARINPKQSKSAHIQNRVNDIDNW